MYFNFSVKEYRDWRFRSCILIAAYYLLGFSVIGLGNENILTNNPTLEEIVMLAADWMPVVTRGELGIVPSEEMMLWRAVMIPAGIACVAIISIIYPSRATACHSRKINGGDFVINGKRLLIILSSLAICFMMAFLCVSIIAQGVNHGGNRLHVFVSIYSINKLTLLIIAPFYYLAMNFFIFCAITTIGIAAYLTLPAEVTGKK